MICNSAFDYAYLLLSQKVIKYYFQFHLNLFSSDVIVSSRQLTYRADPKIEVKNGNTAMWLINSKETEVDQINTNKTSESLEKQENRTDPDQGPKLDSAHQKLLSPGQGNPRRNINSRNKKETERLSSTH